MTAVRHHTPIPVPVSLVLCSDSNYYSYLQSVFSEVGYCHPPITVEKVNSGSLVRGTDPQGQGGPCSWLCRAGQDCCTRKAEDPQVREGLPRGCPGHQGLRRAPRPPILCAASYGDEPARVRLGEAHRVEHQMLLTEADGEAPLGDWVGFWEPCQETEDGGGGCCCALVKDAAKTQPRTS